MAESANREASAVLTLLRWGLLLLILGAFGVLWLPPSWPAQVMALEQHWSGHLFGATTREAVREQAARWASRSPGTGELALTPELAVWLGLDSQAWGAGWSADRQALLQGLHALFLWRLARLAAWGPALLMLLVGAVLDGHWRWRIGQCGFDYPSPIGRQASLIGVGGLILALGLELALPLPLHPALLPVAVMGAGILIATGLRHRPKQL